MIPKSSISQHVLFLIFHCCVSFKVSEAKMQSVMRKESIASLCVSGHRCIFILISKQDILVGNRASILLVCSLSMKFQLAIVAYAYNPNAWEAEAGRLRFKDLKSA